MRKTALVTAGFVVGMQILMRAQVETRPELTTAEGYSGWIVLLAAIAGIVVGYGLSLAQARRIAWKPKRCPSICRSCGSQCSLPPHGGTHQCANGHTW